MGLTNPRAFYGVHSVTPYSRTTGLPYGILKVLDSSSIALSGEQNELRGGSNRYPFASEDGAITSEMNLKMGEFPNFAVELFLGKAPTTSSSAETSGNVSTLTNKYGTSVVASTGLASVSVKSAKKANLKFGKYVVKAVSSTTVKVYASTDIDFGRGDDSAFADDNLSVTSAALSITTGTGTDIDDLGLTLTGGAGTIGFTTGDTATFEVRPVNTGGYSTARIGAAADVFPEFGAIIMAQARSNGELFEIDAFKVKGSGLPLGFESFSWNKPEVKAKLLYDSAKDGVFDIRHVIV